MGSFQSFGFFLLMMSQLKKRLISLKKTKKKKKRKKGGVGRGRDPLLGRNQKPSKLDPHENVMKI
jgi:hypothetical protein